MSEVTRVREVSVPQWLPGLLGFVAGYVDIYTFLALFGLFVAQVTGSFVTAGAEMVTHHVGIAAKVVAVLAFLFAAIFTAGLIAFIRDRGGRALAWMLAFETALLALFTILILTGPPVAGADDVRAILAGVFGAMAMGTQSVIVRLLMRGIPQTNVMTGNMTQLGIETTALLMAWFRRRRDPGDLENVNIFAATRSRLLIVLVIAIGFLLGSAFGAISYATAGLAGAPLAVVIVGALSIWALLHEREA